MAMRETIGSLRAYFILVGIVGVLRSISIFMNVLNPAVTKVGAGIDLVFALAFLGIGVTLRKLLRDSPGMVKALIYATGGMQIVVGLVLFVIVRDPLVLVAPAITLLISWYLLVNVNRLTAAEKPSE